MSGNQEAEKNENGNQGGATMTREARKPAENGATRLTVAMQMPAR
jgi:hypothetical protein